MGEVNRSYVTRTLKRSVKNAIGWCGDTLGPVVVCPLVSIGRVPLKSANSNGPRTARGVRRCRWNTPSPVSRAIALTPTTCCPGGAATGASRTDCTGSATRPSGKTAAASAPAMPLKSSPRCVMPPSAYCVCKRQPTSPLLCDIYAYHVTGLLEIVGIL